MHRKFDHTAFEKKWQEQWEKDGIYSVGNRDERKEKEYVLVEWPYPSGNLHVGHWFAFAVTDIYVRARRMQGKQVLFPMGFDAFGLPAENAAIKRGLDPKGWTESNIAYMKEQLKSMGNAFSWDKTTSSTDPDYYTWTQWIFTEFLKHDIAYRGKGKVNWCPGCNTVLANEQVLPDGTCERSGDTVLQRDMTQWMLRITNFANALVDDLDTLNWPNHIKESQRNWIGRSQGARITFPLSIPSEVQEIAFASTNAGKVARLRELLDDAGLNIIVKTPHDLGITNFTVIEDGVTIRENSLKKARELRLHTSLPVLADDSGFFIHGSEIDPVTVKRNALGDRDEATLSIEEVAALMVDYYKKIATDNGGTIDAEWHNGMAYIDTSGTEHYEEVIRPVLLTNESHGTVDPYLPIRGLYKSKVTEKYALLQTKEEEHDELRPITTALLKLLGTTVDVFTTRPDTLFGATYLVLAPEHPLIEKLKSHIANIDDVEAYQEATRTKKDEERTAKGKEKTGVRLDGVTATNPASKEQIPVFISDYVISTYGTGALMAVPAHDERDNEFAKKFNLRIIQTVKESSDYDQVNQKRNKEFIGELATLSKENDFTLVLVGGMAKSLHQTKSFGFHSDVDIFVDQKGWDILRGYLLEKEYKHATRNGHTERHEWNNHEWFWNEHDWLDMFLLEGNENEYYDTVCSTKHIWGSAEVLQKLSVDDIEYTVPNTEVTESIYQNLAHTWNAIFTASGILTNSGIFTGLDSEEAKEKITAFVGGKMENTYRLRDWSIGRQRYWGVPIPVVYDPEGNAHPIPKEHLPWHLPTDVDHTPTGEPPLSKSQELKDRVTRIFGAGWTPDYETMDTFVDSSWYFLRYIDNANGEVFSSKKAQEDWMPIDVYFGGAEHTTMHLLYSRFWQKALHTLGYVTTHEPYVKRINRGLVLGPDGNKMSKSKGNVIDPDEQVARLGSDTVKMYLAFMGPYGEVTNYPWSIDGIAGIRRFLERVYGLSDHIQETEARDTTRLLHKTIQKITNDVSNYKFNTAISSLMVFMNHVEKAGLQKETYATFLKLLAIFAPHLTEELWYSLGNTSSIHTTSWPEFNPTLVKDDTVTLGVQINGKMKGTITLIQGATEEAALDAVRNDPVLGPKCIGTLQKVIYVQGRILNLIYGE